ncbi:MAG TPA: hypothetical protein VFW44_19155 [Bryobacteraceae bacterium]|nr:hypothetical protein [Bryobacteraceae bacterium]
MNTGFDRHFPYRCWEDYAMGLVSDQQAETLDEHLLICSACQDLLAEADEYVQVAKTALAVQEQARDPSKPLVTDARKRRQLSKAVGAAANVR